jgi:hypothetical protein
MRTDVCTILATTPQQDWLIATGVGLGSSLLVAVLIVWLLKQKNAPRNDPFERLMDRAMERAEAYGGLGPMVTFVFHTYQGARFVFTQKEHLARLPAGVAREYLRELHWFNLRWCVVPYKGSLFVPFLSWGNFRKQMRLIDDQEPAASGLGG